MGRATELRRAALYAVTAIMAGFGLTGVASAQSITNTSGWGGSPSTTVQNRCSVTNTSNVSVNNSNTQSAVSGNAVVAGNGTTSPSWSGWNALSPLNAQAQGMSYNAWWSGVVSWVSNRSGGAGWTNNGTDTSWSPSGNTWESFDPMLWQANGQAFSNWYNSVEAYLNANSPTWLLGWPSTDNSSGIFGASTGNATNNANANFSININNAASAKLGASNCGYANTPAPSSGSCPCGGYEAGSVSNLTKQANQGNQISNQASHTQQSPSSGYSSGYFTPSNSRNFTPSGQVASANTSTTSASQGSNGSGASAYCPPSNSSTSNTPQAAPTTSVNKAAVVNTSVVNVSNASTQTAVSGNSVVNGSGTSGASGSGNAANGNGTGVSADLDN